jgi:diguanylate cyclase (GGDEF)-like protein
MREFTRIEAAAEQISRALGLIGWLSIPIGFAVEQAVAFHAAEVDRDVLVWTLTIFFIAQLLRLGITVAVRRHHRVALSFLLLSVLLWAAGSALLNAGGVPDLTHFPARGELLFLGSFVAMAAYLVLSAGRSLHVPLDTWLHVTVICGGTFSLAGSLLLGPVGAAYGSDPLGMFLALLYPLMDLVLAVLVIGQALLRLRENLADSASLLGAFLLWTFADSHFVADLSTGTYHFSAVSDVAWGVGFALIVGVACRTQSVSARVLPRTQGSTETLVAAGIAITVLALAPFRGIGIYLTIPAVITLVGAGGRLVLALREARGAAEALALSRTDDLTRLPNRRGLRCDLDAAFDAGRPLSLMLLDLDGFKDVNDTLGHSAGDHVLRLMAHRLRQALPPTMGVARLGGDEFAVVVYDTDPIVVMEVGQDLLGQVRAPVRVDGIEILPSASIGIAACPPQGVKSSELLRRADVAMYQAKHQRLGVALYDPADDDFSKTKLRMAEELRRALDEQQFELWYQPQVDVPTQELCGLEALLRWRHPVQGVVSPVEFLPAARQAGLMPAISARVAELAIRDLRRFRAAGVDVRVAINCAPPELLSGTFLPDLFARLEASDVPPSSLVVEVTEDSFIADPERARLVIQDIRAHGLQVAIDDYGTGFSSLAYLRDLAIDELKIDRTFVGSMLADDRTRMIVSSTVQMATALSMRTVAEGVEDADTALELGGLGVDVLQGYHLGQPMPPSEVAAWAADWQPSIGEERVVIDGATVRVSALDHAPARRSLRVLAHHRVPVRDPKY